MWILCTGYVFRPWNLNFLNIAIGNAFAVLNDPVKRKKYDTYGLDAVNSSEPHPFRQGYSAYGTAFEGQKLFPFHDFYLFTLSIVWIFIYAIFLWFDFIKQFFYRWYLAWRAV